MALHGELSFCKTQQVVGFDCAGIERLSVPQPNSCLLLGEPIDLFGANRTSRCYAHFWRVRAGKQRYGGNLATAIVGSTIGVRFSR